MCLHMCLHLLFAPRSAVAPPAPASGRSRTLSPLLLAPQSLGGHSIRAGAVRGDIDRVRATIASPALDARRARRVVRAADRAAHVRAILAADAKRSPTLRPQQLLLGWSLDGRHENPATPLRPGVLEQMRVAGPPSR